MAIVKRLTKGSALTHAELDGNFTDLDTRVSTLETAPDSDSQTLTLVGTDLSISSGNTVDLSGLGGGAGGIALTDISVGAEDPASGDGGISYDNTTGVFTYAPPDLSQYQPVGNLNADIDAHLNISTANSNEVLSWDGSDYAWVAQSSGSSLTNIQDETYGVSVTGKIAVDTIDIGTGGINAQPGGTYDLQGTTIHFGSATIAGGSAFNPVINNHLWSGSTAPTDGYVLSWDASALSGDGDYAWVANAGGTYGDTDVATYLNGNLDTSIIPDTNASYDLGSAEYKIRHLYLSDNSLKFTDTTDPLNIVEYSVGRTGTDITFNGSALKSTSSEDVADAATIDITKTNHFVTNGTTAVLPDGTYMGQKLEFWRVVGTGPVDINVNSAIYMDGGNTATGPGPIVWRLGDANQTLYSCIWNGVAWVLSHGGPGV